jgi:hypothetical protein
MRLWTVHSTAWHAGYEQGRRDALAAARQVDEAMVQRAAEAAWERHRSTAEGHNLRPWAELDPGHRWVWLADTRAALLAALTVPEPEEKR